MNDGITVAVSTVLKPIAVIAMIMCLVMAYKLINKGGKK